MKEKKWAAITCDQWCSQPLNPGYATADSVVCSKQRCNQSQKRCGIISQANRPEADTGFQKKGIEVQSNRWLTPPMDTPLKLIKLTVSVPTNQASCIFFSVT